MGAGSSRPGMMRETVTQIGVFATDVLHSPPSRVVQSMYCPVLFEHEECRGRYPMSGQTLLILSGNGALQYLIKQVGPCLALESPRFH